MADDTPTPTKAKPRSKTLKVELREGRPETMDRARCEALAAEGHVAAIAALEAEQ